MKYKLFISLIILAFFSSFRFGEPSATLTCKSASGRTIFKAELAGTNSVEKAELKIDDSNLTFTQNDKSYIIFDPANKVFTIYLESKTSGNNDQIFFLRFWAIPDSFNPVSSKKGSGTQFQNVYEFKAKLESTEPRKGKEFNTPVIELICNLDYEL